MKYTILTRALALIFLAAAPAALAQQSPQSAVAKGQSPEEVAIRQQFQAALNLAKTTIDHAQKALDAEADPQKKAALEAVLRSHKAIYTSLEMQQNKAVDDLKIALLAESRRRTVKAGDKIYLQCANSGRFLIAPQLYTGYDCVRVGHGEEKRVVTLTGVVSSLPTDKPVTGSPATGADLISGHIVGIDYESVSSQGATRMYESAGGWVYLDNPKPRTENDKYWWKIIKYASPPSQTKEGDPIKEGDVVLFHNEYYKGSYLTSGKRGGEWQWASCATVGDAWRILLVEAPPEPGTTLTRVGAPTKTVDIIETGSFIQNETGEASEAGDVTFALDMSDAVAISYGKTQSWNVSLEASAEATVQAPGAEVKLGTKVTGAFGEEVQRTSETVKASGISLSLSRKLNNPERGYAIVIGSMQIPFEIQEYTCDGVLASIRKIAGKINMAGIRTLTIPDRKGDVVTPISWKRLETDFLRVLDESNAFAAGQVREKKADWLAKGWIVDDTSSDGTPKKQP